jgi:hypothetical protein
MKIRCHSMCVSHEFQLSLKYISFIEVSERFHVSNLTKLKPHQWGIHVIISKPASLCKSTKDQLCTQGPVWSSKQDDRQDDRQANPSFDFLVQMGYHSLELIPNKNSNNMLYYIIARHDNGVNGMFLNALQQYNTQGYCFCSTAESMCCFRRTWFWMLSSFAFKAADLCISQAICDEEVNKPYPNVSHLDSQ